MRGLGFGVQESAAQWLQGLGLKGSFRAIIGFKSPGLRLLRV